MQVSSMSAVVMVGPGGASQPEQLVGRARRAAALDLIDLLRDEGIGPIIVAAPGGSWPPARQGVIRDDDPSGETFHFGRRLADIVRRHRLDTVLYFGGGSAPLLDGEMVRILAGMLRSRRHLPVALTNNRHSSDWVGFTQAQTALDTLVEVESDNSLAWLLEHEAGYDVRVLAALRPSTSMDIDTPADLAILAQYPQLMPYLNGLLQSDAAVPLQRMQLPAVLNLLTQEARQLAIVGRVSPHAWQALSKATRIWIRVFSEERGMKASGRLAHGEVRSMLGLMMDRGGPEAFFADLAGMVDAAIIDSRVFMAHRGLWPAAAERFASDMFDIDAVQDAWLRAFTEAAMKAPIPVVLGGHGLVSGGLYVLAEIVKARLD